MKSRSLFIPLLCLICFSCQELELKDLKEENGQVLPEGVIGFSQLEESDPKVQKAFKSLGIKMGFDNFRLSNIDLVNIANFQYENGLESIAFSIKDEPDRVYGQILYPKTGKEKDYIIADFN